MQQQPLEHHIPVYNTNSTLNLAGSIMHSVTLNVMIGSHMERHTFLVTNIGSEKVILGLPWLRTHNPMMDFEKGTPSFSCCKCEGAIQALDNTGPQNTNTVPPLEDPFELLKAKLEHAWSLGKSCSYQSPIWVAAGFTYLQAITKKAGKKKHKHTFEEIVPPQYCLFSKVSDNVFNRVLARARFLRATSCTGLHLDNYLSHNIKV
jgi:hypothetical protein